MRNYAALGDQMDDRGRLTVPDLYDWNNLPRRQPAAVAVQPAVNGHTNGHTTTYGARALAGEVDTLLTTLEGARNDQLNKSAYKLGGLVASGHLEEAETVESLANAAGQVGLEAREIAATVRSGMRAGVKEPRQVAPLASATIVDVASLIAPPAGASGAQDDAQEERQRTTWWPEPIAQRAIQAAEEPAPTHLVRDDGQALFYSGKVNGLIGESESGKSWVALLAVVQAAAAGQHVLLLDFEDSPASLMRRLRALGVTPEQLGAIDYADPSESLGVAQSGDLQEALATDYQVIVADGVNAAMTLLGYDLNSNTDATLFTTRLLRPLARTGACVITVDHVPKNPDARGKGGIGAQAKRSMMDGTCLLVEVMEPFGKGQSGTLRLTVDKDRNGVVRGICGGGRYAGRAHLDSTGEQVRLRIVAPDQRPAEERPRWRPTGIMEQVSKVIEQAVTPLSGRDITDLVRSRGQLVRQAIAELVADGHIAIAPKEGRGGGHVYRHVSPFRDVAEDSTSEVRPSASEVRPGRGSESASRPPSPYGGGTHFDGTTDTPQNESASGTRLPIDMPDDHSSCNHCGLATPDKILDDTAGYCRACARLWGGEA